jgi:hypothetical protein
VLTPSHVERTTSGKRSMTGRTRNVDPGEVSRRRRALLNALSEANLTPAEAARSAGLSTPNAIYNFVNERTKSLSLDTLKRLAAVIPGATVASLQGDERPAVSTQRTVAVRAEARAGVMRDAFDLPTSEQFEVPVPIDPATRAAGAFGVMVRRPGAENLYPDRTILVVMPVVAYEGTLSSGRRVVLQRIHGPEVEVTVRELDVVDGKAWLWPRSSDPLNTQPVEMPWPCSADRMWRKGEDRFSIAGIVIGSYSPEG